MKLCECGCGQPAPIAKKTCREWGWVKGQPKRFVLGHHMRGRDRGEAFRAQMSELARGSKNHWWKGGSTTTHQGYTMLHARHDHPMAWRGCHDDEMRRKGRAA